MADTLTIWGRKNSINVMKVLWCAAELKLPFERIDVGGPFGTQNAPDYGSVNPNALVPTIRDGEFVLWESNVIVRYLCEKHGKGGLFPGEPAARWEAEKWMDWMQTALNPHLSVILWQTVRTPVAERNMEAVETARGKSAAAFAILDGWLKDRSFVAGAAFSMGDIPVGAAAYRWFAFDIERPDLPHLRKWYESLCEREPFREHIMQPLT